MNKSVTDFIHTVLSQIKYKKVHSTISEELNNHIYELADGYMTDGMEEEEAYYKAIIQMGDPVQIGKSLHKTHKPKTEWSIILLLGAIVVYGLYIFSIYSSMYSDSESFYKQIFFAAVGSCALVALYFFDYTRLEKFSVPAYFITCVLLFMIIIQSSKQNGRSYVLIFEFGFNPAFMAIPILLICYSGLVKKWCDGQIKNLLKLIAASTIPLFCALIEPSLVNMLIMGAGFLTMLSFGICGSNYKGNRKKTLLIIYGALCGLALLSLIYLVRFIPYTHERLYAFINPQPYRHGAGWVYTLLDNIINSAKFIGASGSFLDLNINGLVHPMLPGTESEFILMFVIGRFGWLFGILMIVLLSSLIFRLFIVSSRVRHVYGKYLCVGICCVFSLQVIVNVLMNLRLLPTISVSLPFFSYGGASYLLNMALLGLFLGIYRRKDIIKTKE